MAGIEPASPLYSERQFSILTYISSQLNSKLGGDMGNRTPTYALQGHRAPVITMSPSSAPL